ncbi:MAG: alpha/beta hydrolase-fold protein [Bacteroidales bacterium]|nr:alpha/beta hydrolase-fold protein [Bacteroidales bacterium]MDD3100244.1 alpha/beta hydrolase-fold protein [Bacteroidales bacterium]MDD3943196.1 alpha/beta hydrolase-fold protein [Bacteroidales bacterium]MDD5714946.1 alpha/beta hydrolase-fold protein [Bacteroidales bacterium]MDY0358269.1 alpha/beta hydrolase-fold protein [Bacteroidales bacterium]
MKKLTFIALTVLLSVEGLFAQQALFSGGPQITSPQVNPDNSVTFRLLAPDAREVRLTGDFIPAQGWMPGSELMTKDDKGIWEYTTKPLDSDLYGYAFTVDGLRMMDPNNVHQIRDVATVTNIVIVGGGQGDLYSVRQVPHGTVTRTWYDSPSNKYVQKRRVTVYTPPGYENSKKKYPVFYLLHGMGGDEEAWINLGRTAQIMDNLIAAKKAKPMIVVMTNGNVVQEAAPGESSLGLYKPTMQLDGTMDGQFESSFKDVIRFVENNYRVIPKSHARAIAGLSMGGYHTLHISRFYHKTFDYIGLFSAAVMPDEKVAGSPVYQDIEGTLKQQRDNGFSLYWIGIGKEDFLYKANVDYRQLLDKINFPYVYRESGGGHTWTNWRLYLSEFAPLLFK